MKKILLLMFSLILLSSFVSADLVSYYQLSDLDDKVGSNDLTNTGTTNNVNYPSFNISGSGSPNSSDFDGNAHYIDTNSNVDLTDDFSISMWVNRGTTGIRDILWSNGVAVADEGIILQWDTDNHFDLNIFGGVGITSDSSFTDTSSFNHVVVIRNVTDGSVSMYVNGVLDAYETTIGSYTGTGNIRWGALDWNTAWDLIGQMDEMQVFNNSLSEEQVLNLYNYGVSTGLPVNISYFNITAFSFWNGSVIDTFNATINGVDYNTSNGTIYTLFNQSIGNLTNITVWAEGRFNNSYVDYNSSVSLVSNMKQTDIIFNFLFSSGDLIPTPINLTRLDTNSSFNVTNGSINIFPDEGVQYFNARCDDEIFAPFDINLSFSALENNSYNFTVNETQNVITFLDANTSSPISGANITVYYPSGASINRITNASGQINFSYIYNGTLEFGDYTYNFNKVGYVLINLSDTINSSVIPHSRTYNMSRAKLNIFIYDRTTRELLDGVNVTVAFIGLFNETTNNGTLIKDNLTIVGGDYLIYASASGFKTSVRSLTFTNQEEFTFNFYLLNLSNSNAGILFVNTRDSFFRQIPDAKVSLLEYVPSLLSYVSVDECVTNIDAECNVAVELNSKVYYLRSTAFIDGELRVAETSQNGEVITVNNDVRNLIFFTRTEFEVSPQDNLIYEITPSFINNVSSISIEFSTLDGSAEKVCIEYFKKVDGSFVSVTGDTYCLLSSDAIQNIDASVTLNRSNTYRADVYINKSTYRIPLDSFDYPSISSISEVFTEEYIGAFIMICWIFALGVSLYLKNMVLFFILALVLSWASVIIFPLYSIVSISVFKTVIGLVTIMIARKKEDFT